MLTRRRFIAIGVTGAAGSAAVGASLLTRSSRPALEPDREAPADDFSARFARFEAAEEPDGDLAKVVWPAFVTEAGPEVQRLYEFQITNGGIMRYMPCFCGCGQGAEHRNNRDCYVRGINADRSVVLDSMAPT